MGRGYVLGFLFGGAAALDAGAGGCAWGRLFAAAAAAAGKRPALELLDRVWRLDRPVADKDLEYCVNTASSYSPWSVASAREGFLTIAGGHRMGVCGETVTEGARVTGFRRISSLCLRVARDIRGRSWVCADSGRARMGEDHPPAGPVPLPCGRRCRGRGGQPGRAVSTGLSDRGGAGRAFRLRKRNRHYYGSANHGSGLYCRR